MGKKILLIVIGVSLIGLVIFLNVRTVYNKDVADKGLVDTQTAVDLVSDTEESISEDEVESETEIVSEAEEQEGIVEDTEVVVPEIEYTDISDLTYNTENILNFDIVDSAVVHTYLYENGGPLDYIINNMAAFNVFKERFPDAIGSDEFKNVFNIDEDYFNKYRLVVRLEPSTNGAQSFNISHIYLDEHGMPIIQDEIITEGDVGTDVMSTWFLFASLEK